MAASMGMTRKRKVVLALLASTLSIGMAGMLAPSQAWSASIDLVAIFATTFLIFAWYCEDARERAFRRGYWQNFGVAGAALIGLPVYLFRSRGARGGALATGGVLLFYLLMLVLVIVGSLIGLAARAIFGMPLPLG